MIGGVLWTKIKAIAVFSAFYAVQIYVLPHLTGILNFLVLFTTGFFCRILPSVAIAAYAVKTTTVSELISGMERIHMPKEVTIPLTVMFRLWCLTRQLPMPIPKMRKRWKLPLQSL